MLRLLELVDREVTPCVPSYGSVGASGDLAPLAHMSLALIGEGEVSYRGRRGAGAGGARSGGAPTTRAAPQGRPRAHQRDPTHERVRGARGRGERAACWRRRSPARPRRWRRSRPPTACSTRAYTRSNPTRGRRAWRRRVDACTREAKSSASHRDCDRVQDPYSFRCIPQVLGAVDDTLEWIETWIVREINAVTDNPIVFPDDGDVISGGNFHGEHMAFALDALAIAACEIAVDRGAARRPSDGRRRRASAALSHRQPGAQLGFHDHAVPRGGAGEREQDTRAPRVGRHHPDLDGVRGSREHGQHLGAESSRGCWTTWRAWWRSSSCAAPRRWSSTVRCDPAAGPPPRTRRCARRCRSWRRTRRCRRTWPPLETRVRDGDVLAAVEKEVGPLVPRDA